MVGIYQVNLYCCPVFLHKDSSIYLLIRSRLASRLENCFSQTSLKRAKTLRFICSWSSKMARDRKNNPQRSCWSKVIMASRVRSSLGKAWTYRGLGIPFILQSMGYLLCGSFLELHQSNSRRFAGTASSIKARKSAIKSDMEYVFFGDR